MNQSVGQNTKKIVTDFTEEDIAWPGGKALFSWWDKARGDKKFPAREDFSPNVMPAFLKTIILYEVEGPGKAYCLKLAGSGIADLMGFDPTGSRLHDLPGTETQLARFNWVVENKKPYMCLNIPASWAQKNFRTYSTVMFPLGPDGEEVTMLIAYLFFEKNQD